MSHVCLGSLELLVDATSATLHTTRNWLPTTNMQGVCVQRAARGMRTRCPSRFWFWVLFSASWSQSLSVFSEASSRFEPKIQCTFVKFVEQVGGESFMKSQSPISPVLLMFYVFLEAFVFTAVVEEGAKYLCTTYAIDR